MCHAITRVRKQDCCHVPLCAGVVDAVLIPEVHFELEGEKGLFKYLHGVVEAKGHCVVCVAEGAGQVRTPGDADVAAVKRKGAGFERKGAGFTTRAGGSRFRGIRGVAAL